MRELARKHRREMTPHLVEFSTGPCTAEELTSAVMARKALCNKMWRLMSDFDLLLTPTLTVPPFPVHMQGPEKVDGRIVPPFAWLSFTQRPSVRRAGLVGGNIGPRSIAVWEMIALPARIIADQDDWSGIESKWRRRSRIAER
jgi:hypothetical protein